MGAGTRRGAYTVKSAYNFLMHAVAREDQEVFVQVWSKFVPTKVCALAWRVILDRIPTKANLLKRNVLSVGSGVNCVFCNVMEETTEHLLFSCPRALQVWLCCYNWVGVSTALPKNCQSHLLQHELPSLKAKQNRLWKVVWLVVIWTLGE